jgi:hypothetical protein
VDGVVAGRAKHRERVGVGAAVDDVDAVADGVVDGVVAGTGGDGVVALAAGEDGRVDRRLDGGEVA